MTSQGIALLGGTFNPPHIGHLRLALELLNHLPEHISDVDFIPCAHPPHKSLTNLLPFELRAAMLEKALEPFPHLHCNRMESERQGFSYTWDTLNIYRERHPDRPLYFILGNEDYTQLPSWYHGAELLQLAHFLIVQRADTSIEMFKKTTLHLYPKALFTPPLLPNGLSALLPNGHTIHYLPLPRLDISASLIREHWLHARNINFLVPDAILPLFKQHETTLYRLWSQSTGLGDD